MYEKLFEYQFVAPVNISTREAKHSMRNRPVSIAILKDLSDLGYDGPIEL